MRVLVIYNPVAGSGQGVHHARSLVESLRGLEIGENRVIEITAEPTQAVAASQWLDPLLEGVELLVVVGGDGAVRLAAASAIRARVPIFHYPSGTENLFARDHGMRPEPAVLAQAITHGHTRHLDVFRVDGELGVLFASTGFDAEVVHDHHARRKGSISHLSYVAPIIRQLLTWHRARCRVRVEVDGTMLEAAGHGLALVANSPQYALRINPASDACPDDGLLDVMILPARSILGLLGWLVRCRSGRHLGHPRLLRARGRRVTLTMDRPTRLQIDGDPARVQPPRSTYEILLEPGALGVRCPPSENPAAPKKISA